ncbi:MAG: hypothetical protein ABEI52_05520, partial [Halobacteriaceae archaeon]
ENPQFLRMSAWACAIAGCGRTFDDVRAILAHQIQDHDSHACKICGDEHPSGYFAIKHTFTEHTRAEYVRYYNADADAIRERESLMDVVEKMTNPEDVRQQVPTEATP